MAKCEIAWISSTVAPRGEYLAH